MIGAQKTKDDGVVTLSVKIPAWMADQLNAIAKMRGEDVTANHLLALCLQFIVESAKHTGPIANEFQALLNMMKIDASWNKAFNFSRIDAQMDVAQAILILQHHWQSGWSRSTDTRNSLHSRLFISFLYMRPWLMAQLRMVFLPVSPRCHPR